MTYLPDKEKAALQNTPAFRKAAHKTDSSALTSSKVQDNMKQFCFGTRQPNLETSQTYKDRPNNIESANSKLLRPRASELAKRIANHWLHR